jgi:hypothetical protein
VEPASEVDRRSDEVGDDGYEWAVRFGYEFMTVMKVGNELTLGSVPGARVQRI